jgi:hypothetical protein
VQRLGYGKVTDQLVRDIRHKRIDKSSATVIEQEYLNKIPEGVQEFAGWLGLSPKGFNSLLVSHDKEFALKILTEEWHSRLSDLRLKSDTSGRVQDELIDLDFTNIGKGI